MIEKQYTESIEYDWHKNANALGFTNELALVSIATTDETFTRFLMRDEITQSIHWLDVYKRCDENAITLQASDQIWHTENYIYCLRK